MITPEQNMTLQQWVDSGMNKSVIVRAIAQLGVQRVLDCIDAVNFDWEIGDTPAFRDKNMHLTSVLKIAGMHYD